MGTQTLPIIENCDGCGACCMQQGSPPGYVYLLQCLERGEDITDWPDPQDLARIENLPHEALTAVLEYWNRLRNGVIVGEDGSDPPCCWFDEETRRCRFHEHRPQICRDLDVGSDGCRAWRDEYNVGV